MDVRQSSFLLGDLKEKIYMKLPPSMVVWNMRSASLLHLAIGMIVVLICEETFASVVKMTLVWTMLANAKSQLLAPLLNECKKCFPSRGS